MNYGELTAERQKNVSLHKSFRCRVCKKFKEPGLFSNKELGTYRFKCVTGERPTPISAKLRCRDCAGSGYHELQCKQCDIWKELQQFSKAARMAGGSGWCKACTLWKEAAEHDIIPQAHPSGDLAPDEDPFPTSLPSNIFNTHHNSGYSSDPEAGSDDDYENYSTVTREPEYPAATQSFQSSAAAFWSPAAQSVASSTAAFAQFSVSDAGCGAQDSRSTNQPSASDPVSGGASSSLRMNPGNVAQNMGAGRSRPLDTQTASSVSNPYEEDRASATTRQSGWSVVDSSGRVKVVPKAWDAKAVDYIHKRFLSDQRSDMASTTGTKTTTTTASPAAPKATTRSGWAKAVGSKNKQPAYNAADHQPQGRRQHNDGSEDDM